jgi:hypothetical protein
MSEIFVDSLFINYKCEITDGSDFQLEIILQVVKEQSRIIQDFQIGSAFKDRAEIVK